MNFFTNSRELDYYHLVDKFESTRLEPVLNGYYEPKDAFLRSIGAQIVKFEQIHKIDLAREVITQERELLEKIQVFKKVVEHFEGANDQTEWLISELIAGRIKPDQISHYCGQFENHSVELKVAKATLERLEASLGDVLERKAFLPKQALLDAAKPSPLGGNRPYFEDALEVMKLRENPEDPSPLAA